LRFRHPQRNRHLAVGLEAVMLAAYPKLLILDELGYLPRHQQQGLHRLRRGLQRPRTGDGDPRPPAAPPDVPQHRGESYLLKDERKAGLLGRRLKEEEVLETT
jgi:hypothetical protein